MSSRLRKDYYAYIYADPSRPWDGSTEAQRRRYGRDSIQVRSGRAQPFYVGKGNGRRMYAHWRDKGDRLRISTYNSLFYRYLRKMDRENIEPVIVRIVWSLTEQKAHDEEVRSIRDLGRLRKGPLLNMTDGGEGSSGWIPTKKWREAHREAISGANNPCFGKNGSEHPRFGGKHSDAHKAWMREISRERANRPAVKTRMRKRMLGNRNPAKRREVREAMREAGKIRAARAHQRVLLLARWVYAARASGLVTCDEIKKYLDRNGVTGARGGHLARSSVWYALRRIDEGITQPHRALTGGKRYRHHLQKSKARTSNTLLEKTRRYLERYGGKLLAAYQDSAGNCAAAARLLRERGVRTLQNRGKWTNYRLRAMLDKYLASAPSEDTGTHSRRVARAERKESAT